MVDLTGIVLVDYVLCGVIGGVTYVIVAKYGFEDKADIIRRLALGAIAGFIVYVAGLPNSVTALTGGYFGIDVIEAILSRYKPAPPPEPNGT